jgi:hypothetical protein
MNMSLNHLIRKVFPGANDAPEMTAISEEYLRKLISEESNNWNLAAVKLAASSESLTVGPRNEAREPGRASAQEVTLHWNELALARLHRKTAA